MSQFAKIYGYLVLVFIIIVFFILKCSTPTQNKVEQKKSDTLVVDTTLKK
jgi:hypothetical protein